MVINCVDIFRKEDKIHTVYDWHIEIDAFPKIIYIINQLENDEVKENFIFELIYKLILVTDYLHVINIHAKKIEFRFLKCSSQSVDDIRVYIDDLVDLNKNRNAQIGFNDMIKFNCFLVFQLMIKI